MNLKNETNNKSGFFLETGPIAEQTFSNGSATANPQLFVGGSEYADIFNTTNRNYIQVQADGAGEYDLEYVGFGQVTFDYATKPPKPDEGFFEQLGYPNQPQSAILALDFVGMGLPYYLWKQTTNLLYKVDETIASELTCEDVVGG